MARNRGKWFEEFMQWIQSGLHPSSEVAFNVEIPDVDSGESREIDILITMRDGPTELLVIGECRDHKKKPGSPWIEQVATKMQSVGAHAAFVASRNGISGPAEKKARKHGIAVFSLADLEGNAVNSWVRTSSIGVIGYQAGLHVRLWDLELRRSVAPSDECWAPIAAQLAPPFEPEQIRPGFHPVCDLIRQQFPAIRDEASEDLDETNPMVECVTRTELMEGFEITASDGQQHVIQGVELTFRFERTITRYPLALWRVQRGGHDRPDADVLEGSVRMGDQEYRIRVMGSEFPAQGRGVRRVTTEVLPINSSAKERYRGHRVVGSAPPGGSLEEDGRVVTILLS